jgi:hypothetical protein
MTSVKPAGRPEPIRLEHLRCQLATARTREQLQLRERGARADVISSARQATLVALVDYADAIEALSWPVPRTLLAEIKLYRCLTRSLPPRHLSR